MYKQGEVLEKLDNNVYKITVERGHACSHCGACSSGNNKIELQVKSELNLTRGDKVLLDIKGTKFLKVAFVAYFMPVVLLAFGYGIGSLVSRLFFKFSDVFNIFIGIGLVILYYILLYRKVKNSNEKSIAKIVKVIKQ